MSDLKTVDVELFDFVNHFYKMIHPHFDELEIKMTCSEDNTYFRVQLNPVDMDREGLGGEVIGVRPRVDSKITKTMGIKIDKLILDAKEADDEDAFSTLKMYRNSHRDISYPRRQGNNLEESKKFFKFVIGMWLRKKMLEEGVKNPGFQHAKVDVIFIDKHSIERQQQRSTK